MAVRHPTSIAREPDGVDFDDSPILLGGDRTTDPAPYANRVQIYPKRDAEGDLDLYLLDEMNRVTRLTNSGAAFASASDIIIEASARLAADVAEAATRLAADIAEGNARAAADTSLLASIIAAVGTGSVDAIPKRTGANALGDSSIKEGTSGIEPVTDQVTYLGTSLKRFLALISKQGIYNKAATTDAEYISYLSQTALAFGAGGASPPDALLTRPSAGILTVTGKLQQATTPATGVDLGNKTYIDAAIAAARTSSLLDTSFFSAHGLLPSGVIQAGVDTFPTADFSVFEAGNTVTITKSRLRFNKSGGSRWSNIGWNFGANKTKALFIVGGCHTTSFRHILSINDAQPSSEQVAGANSIGFRMDAASTVIDVGSMTSAAGWNNTFGWTQLDALSGTFWTPANMARCGMALYIDTVGHLVKAFLQAPTGQWFSVSEISNSYLSALRCASIMIDVQTTGYDFVTPVGIYAE